MIAGLRDAANSATTTHGVGPMRGSAQEPEIFFARRSGHCSENRRVLVPAKQPAEEEETLTDRVLSAAL